MKLTYLNKTVEINIPLTTKRLKQHILDEFFDSYNDGVIPVYENEKFLYKLGSFEGSSDIEEIPVKIIGQWMSGGADSSLLAYLLCKKIRDDDGYWHEVEKYIAEHSSADFTHTICPKCAKKLYKRK